MVHGVVIKIRSQHFENTYVDLYFGTTVSYYYGVMVFAPFPYVYDGFDLIGVEALSD